MSFRGGAGIDEAWDAQNQRNTGPIMTCGRQLSTRQRPFAASALKVKLLAAAVRSFRTQQQE